MRRYISWRKQDDLRRQLETAREEEEELNLRRRR